MIHWIRDALSAAKAVRAVRKSGNTAKLALVEEQEIVRVARARSTEMINTAEARSKELQRLATSYIDDLMRQAEESLSSSLAAVQQRRSAFTMANDAVRKMSAGDDEDKEE